MIMKNRIKILSLIVIGLFLAFMIGCEEDDNNNTVTDIDGNIYTTVTIGTQVWTVENLAVTKYNDGTAIPLVTDESEWSKLTTAGYCWYNNEESTYKKPYGALYNWHAVNSGKLCPKGWHVPSDAEWSTLSEYLKGDSIAGSKLKEADTTHWKNPNTGTTNESGFTALPGGGHYFNGKYGWLGRYGTYWTSTEGSSSSAWTRYVRYNSKALFRESYDKKTGYSVRCIKD
jgi:uncharacterized protein (TIGR02145 family)